MTDVPRLNGGLERYVLETATFLRKRGYRSTLLYNPLYTADPLFLGGFDASFPISDVKRQVEITNPDIIYVHRLTDVKALEGLNSSGKPVIRFFHDHRLFCLREHRYRTISKTPCHSRVGATCIRCLGFIRRKTGFPFLGCSCLSSLLSEQALNRGLSKFIVASDYMKKELLLNGFQRDKIRVNPLYSEGGVAEWCKSSSENEIVFAGQLVRGKGLDLLLSAMTLVNSTVKLSIYGDGRQKGELVKLAQKMGLSDSVVFRGKAGKEELFKAYRRAVAVVVPSRMPEPFCLVGVEAMSCGRPVVAFRQGAVETWLSDRETGFAVPFGDVAAMAGAVERIVEDTELSERMGKKALEDYRNRFLPRFHIERLIQVFDECLEEENGSNQAARSEYRQPHHG